jgi:dihydroorotase-like cyclic amidohydrolase
MTTINQRKRPYEFGLKRICLGNVRRDVIYSSPIQKLIDMSASKHDKHTSEEDDDDDAGMDTETSLTHIMTNLKFMPKATIIRGNTIWWQRRQLRPES